MAKETGLGWTTFQVDDSTGTLRDLKSPTINLAWTLPRGVQDVTSLAVSAYERLLLLADMALTINLVFDDAANSAHAVFSDVPSSAVAREFLIVVSGQTLGTTNTPTLLPTDYSMTRAQDGSFVGVVPMVLANGAIPAWS